MGLDVLLYDGEKECPEVPSEKYPDHHFKRTYLRSSYNAAGFNSVVSLLCDGKDLYYIFGVGEPESDIIRPDWAASRRRAVELLEALRKVAAEMPFQVATIPVSAAFGPGPQINTKQALEIFRAEYKKERAPGWDSYSNGVGTFFSGRLLRWWRPSAAWICEKQRPSIWCSKPGTSNPMPSRRRSLWNSSTSPAH